TSGWSTTCSRMRRTYRGPAPSVAAPSSGEPRGDDARMCAVASFSAVLARVGSGWKARDVEVDEAVSLDDLADSLRSVAVDEQPVLAVIEHEDEWFAIVRVD